MEKHLRISPVFESRGSYYAYVPCIRYMYREHYLKVYPKEVEFMKKGYGLVNDLKTTKFPTKVTCPECKQTWEYIEASIEHGKTP